MGKAIADIITKLHRTGTHPSLEELRKEIPAGVLEMLAVPGLRPKKVPRLYKELRITSLCELEAAAKDDRIKQAKASLQKARPSLKHVTIAGDFRRGCEHWSATSLLLPKRPGRTGLPP